MLSPGRGTQRPDRSDRWGASLEINPRPEDEEGSPEEQRSAPLLLYDLWSDPYCLKSLHEEQPDLVEKYTKFLEAQWEAHQTLAQQFTRWHKCGTNF